MEKTSGKMISIDKVIKALDGKISGAEIDEAIGKLLSAGYFFRLKRGFIQKM